MGPYETRVQPNNYIKHLKYFKKYLNPRKLTKK